MYRYIVKKWITLRMAAHEFYFKEPYEIKEEYAIMKSILFFALVPIELFIIFTYARIYGSLSEYNLQIILIVAIVNLLLSNILINRIKDKPFIGEIISSYNQTDYDSRRKLYSLRNGMTLILLIVVMPWLLCFISIAIVCYIYK